MSLHGRQNGPDFAANFVANAILDSISLERSNYRSPIKKLLFNNRFYILITYFPCVMEQHYSKNVNNGLNTHIYSYIETFGGQSFNLYLNVIQFFNASIN